MTNNVLQNSFKKYSKEIVKQFLQSVMVVDDQAYYPSREQVSSDFIDKVPKEISSPGLKLKNPKSKDVDKKQPADRKEVFSNDNEHRLNVKILIDSFAGMGIGCTVIQPESSQEGDLATRVEKLARKSDVIVFDWVLAGDSEPGKTVSHFVAKITEHSTEETKKMRLIVIYTGNSDLEAVFNYLKKVLENKGLLSDSDKENLTMTHKSVRIFILAKQYADIPETGTYFKLKIDEKTMPEKLIEEFTEMTFGLVPNVALQSFAVIRDNTHQVLAKYHSRLDAPFATHRFMLPHPSDANEFLTTLIGSEITALLEGKKVGEIADKSKIDGAELNFLEEWVNNLVDENSELPERWKRISENLGINKENGKKIVYEFLTEDTVPEKRLQKKISGLSSDEKKEFAEDIATSLHKKNITCNFHLNEDEAKKMDMEFAYRTSVASFYKDKPNLRFGSLLKRIDSEINKYYLCVQPLCDCMRISGKRNFPFLELKVISNDEKRFDLVIKDNGNYIKVQICFRPYDSLFVEFKANNKTKIVESREDDNKFVFSSTHESPHKYLWLGELKFAHAQRVANEFATKFSRVGLDESEWLRRSALKIEK
jgi:hypothetical protein